MKISLVTPVHNDWPLVECLLADIDAVQFSDAVEISVLIVDDASSDLPPWKPPVPYRQIVAVDVLYLTANLGHQRAIAVGLAEIALRGGFDAVVVMDADGEDRPSDIAALVARFTKMPRSIVVAQRAKRSESALFRAFYRVYQGGFRLLTGHPMDFGNFCLLGPHHVERLLAVSDLWNLAASLLRSGLPIARVPTARGRRYQGRSRLNFTDLLIHGLRAIAVFAEKALTRLAFAAVVAAGVFFFAVAGIAALAGGGTGLPILVGQMFVQVAVTALVGALVVMNRRSIGPGISPADLARATAARRAALAASPASASEVSEVAG